MDSQGDVEKNRGSCMVHGAWDRCPCNTRTFYQVQFSLVTTTNSALGHKWTLIHFDADVHGSGGVGVFLSSRVYSRITNMEPITSRLLEILLALWKDHKMHLLIGYSPTAIADKIEKQLFHDQLVETIRRLSSRDFVCIAADLNISLQTGNPFINHAPVRPSLQCQ